MSWRHRRAPLKFGSAACGIAVLAQIIEQPALQIRPPTAWAVLNLKDVWQFRDLLLALAGRDVKLRYKQTALGVIWVVLQPLIAAAIFALVFGRLAKLPSDGIPYFLYAYVGLLAWNLFSNTVSRASMCLISNSQLISKIFFPRLVLPLSTIPSALIDFAVAFAMLIVLMPIYKTSPSLPIITFPFWLLLVLMLSGGVGLWTAALTVSYRDVQYILPVILQFLLFGSPISYSSSVVSPTLRWAYQLNPLAPILQGFHWSLLNATPPSLLFTGYSTLITFGIAISGAFAFKQMERKFADVI